MNWIIVGLLAGAVLLAAGLYLLWTPETDEEAIESRKFLDRWRND